MLSSDEDNIGKYNNCNNLDFIDKINLNVLRIINQINIIQY